MNQEVFDGRNSKRIATVEPDAQGLNMQYISDDQAIYTQFSDLNLIRGALTQPTTHLDKQSIFGAHFKHSHKERHKRSDAPEEKWEELNFNQIKVRPGKDFKGAFVKEQKESARSLIELIKLRDAYTFDGHQDYVQVEQYVNYHHKEPQIIWNKRVDQLPIMEQTEVHQENGVFYTVTSDQTDVQVPTMYQFIKDLLYLMNCINNNSIASFCYSQLKFLEQKFQMHEIFNHQVEQSDQKSIKKRDFYNVFKVDTHIHHSAAMSANHLLNFMVKKFETSPNETVGVGKDGNKITVSNIFTDLGVDPNELSLDSLDVQADKGMYKRFDRFNNKYNPLGTAKLREVFLKQDNYIKGKYLAEITKELMNMLDEQKYIGTEWRISVYGKSMYEWHKLAKWLVKFKLYSSRVRWMVQIPRLYAVYKKSGMIQSFQDMIDNIFRPLFDVTINPTIDPYLYQVLFQIVGFDTVDDESLYEHFSIQDLKNFPKDWQKDRNPPYTYWIYYIYANLYTLNVLRAKRGLNTFKFRPHCGEAGNIDHLATAYLVADGINHGVELNKSPVLTYLYYLKQIGMAMSPVSNNKLFCRYAKSPFLKYFQVGLNVSLSTDDPLILHLTNEPLLEEYAIASQVFDLSAIDQAELARNSVKQSGFEEIIKRYWVGDMYNDRLQQSNEEAHNNLPQSRFQYRKTTLNEEYDRLEQLGSEILF